MTHYHIFHPQQPNVKENKIQSRAKLAGCLIVNIFLFKYNFFLLGVGIISDFKSQLEDAEKNSSQYPTTNRFNNNLYSWIPNFLLFKKNKNEIGHQSIKISFDNEKNLEMASFNKKRPSEKFNL